MSHILAVAANAFYNLKHIIVENRITEENSRDSNIGNNEKAVSLDELTAMEE